MNSMLLCSLTAFYCIFQEKKHANDPSDKGSLSLFFFSSENDEFTSEKVKLFLTKCSRGNVSEFHSDECLLLPYKLQ